MPYKVCTIYVCTALQNISLQIELTKLLFISDYLVGQGSTVWKGVLQGYLEQPASYVVVKNNWIDPLRKFTEGAILQILNKAGIEGIPTLIYEVQVTTQAYNKNDGQTMVNQSTHHVCATLQWYPKPVGSLVTDFHSLGELLVSFLDFVIGKHSFVYVAREVWQTQHCSAHRDALEKAGILHYDISLMNLLLTFLKTKQNNHYMLMDHLPSMSWLTLCMRINGLP